MTDTETGWGNPRPFDARSKFHYYGEDGRALCGKWARLAGQPTVEEGMDDHGDNCAECKRKKASRVKPPNKLRAAFDKEEE